MKLIIGLGNPGKKYAGTWHNLGFSAVEELREVLDLPAFKKSAKFQADVSDGAYGQEKIILAEPLTYMNNSGNSVKAMANFYKIKPTDIVVIHDDIDLPLGKIRLATNSSAGGHNGVKSIIERLGTKNFNRVKIGIKTERLNKVDAADYVLEKIPSANRKTANEAIKKAVSALETAIVMGYERAMNEYN